jgi:hypothetical protein
MLRAATLDCKPVSGFTHTFYRYPARFSPRFAGTVIDLFSAPGDLIVDPYMGGGTTVVEGFARGREVVGSDVNSLGVFVARAKTTPLGSGERAAILEWADRVVPSLSYSLMPRDLDNFVCERRTRNLTLPQARALKKVMALALRTLKELPTEESRAFARCALLNVGQLFLNGRRGGHSVKQFRQRLQIAVREMADGLSELQSRTLNGPTPILLNASAADLSNHVPFLSGRRATLVVTSPPYPGIHMLYHRWQVDGRRETPAPYWLANCQDGRGNAYYNFASRSESGEDNYFAESLKTLKGIRAVMRDGGLIAQLVAFSDPPTQVPRYQLNMEAAGFGELRFSGHHRIWRDVPSRRWHANMKGKLNSSREVLLLHQAV